MQVSRPTEEEISEWATTDDTALRRAVDRARMLAGNNEDVESLLQPTPEESVTLEKALAELPRMLTVRRTTATMVPVDDGGNKSGSEQ